MNNYLIALYIYIGISFIVILYTIRAFWLEDKEYDRRGYISCKFGYNLRKGFVKEGSFTLFNGGWSSVLLFTYLPFVNIIWVYIYIAEAISKIKSRNRK